MLRANLLNKKPSGLFNERRRHLVLNGCQSGERASDPAADDQYRKLLIWFDEFLGKRTLHQNVPAKHLIANTHWL
jgi:hypothetical protein